MAEQTVPESSSGSNQDNDTLSVNEVAKDLKPGPEISSEALITDYGNSLRLQFYFYQLIIYHCLEKVWLRWTGTHWERDSKGSVVKLMVKAIRNIQTVEIPWLQHMGKIEKKANNGKKGKEDSDVNLKDILEEWLVKSLSRSKLKAAIDLATSLLPLDVELDKHKHLLNVKNGTIDLRDGTLLPHNREDYLTKIAPIEFIPDAPCPKFLEFLNRAFPNNPDGIRFIQKMLGYALTGDVSEKRFFIFWGAAGNNGKTMIFNVIRGILGVCYRVQLASESLVSGRLSSIRSDLAKLKGFRFVTASETDRKYKFNEALIKLMTGGDTLTARHPGEKEIEFEPELKLFLGTNPKPVFNLSDEAMMNRVCIVPFYISIPPEEQNKKLTQELIDEEASGILAWMVQGAVLWHKEGLGVNPFDEKDAYVIRHIVSLEEFIKECCDRNDKNSSTSHTDLLKAFNAYKDQMNDPTPDSNDKEFSKLLDDAGIISKRSGKGNVRVGIKLNAEGVELLKSISDVTPSQEQTENGMQGVHDVQDDSN